MGNREKNLVGIDIGGTKIAGVLWSRGKVRRELQLKTPKGRKAFLACLFEFTKALSRGQKVAGIGLSVAGAVNFRRGIILRSPNLRFLNSFALRSWLAARLKRPVRLDNDAKCFLRGEAAFGQARGKKNVVALTLGTGVGGAVTSDGRLLRGSHVSAFELGHTIVSRERGKFLTLEELVSSHGFKRFGVNDPLAVQNKGFAGEPKAIGIYKKIGTYLGVGLANFVNVFDPELVLLGGGISRADQLLVGPAIREMRKHTLASITQLPPVKISKLKHAGALGAISLFLK